MKEDRQLGYLVLDVVDTDALDRILGDVLGMQGQTDAGCRVYRMDGWDRRFIVQPSSLNRIGGIGLVANDDVAFAELRQSLDRAAVAVTEGTREEAALRRVRHFIGFKDPDGVAVEVAVAPSEAPGHGYRPDLVPGGFVTGSQGLGHAVLLASNRDETVSFYSGVLGFRVSDTIEEETPVGTVEATFLHCNRRHHTIAVGQRRPHMPADRALSHFMVQTTDLDAVGLAYDRALDAGLPITRTLGRHPNDGMFSFYLRTPAGFDIEFGSGAIEIGENWQIRQLHQGSAWGHRPGQGMPART